MFLNRDIIRLQAKKYGSVPTEGFRTMEDYFLSLIHLKAYEEAAKIAQDKNVLDCGCNNGYGTKVISEHCKEIIGVDVSPKTIQEARHRFGSKGIDFQLCDGIHLPFENTGKSDHEASVRSTQRIPSKTLRLSAQGLLPFFGFLAFGNNGSIFFHCSFVNFQFL